MRHWFKVVLLSGVLASPSYSADWFEGKWCDRNTKTVLVETNQIVFNDRNYCDWMVAPDEAPYISPLYCKNISTETGTRIEKFHQTFVIAAEPLGSNRLRITIGQNNTEYKRCEEED